SVFALGDGGVVQPDLDLPRADRDAFDRVAHALVASSLWTEPNRLGERVDRLHRRGDGRRSAGHPGRAIVRREGGFNGFHHLFLNLRRWDTGDGSGVLPAALQQRSGDVVSPAPPALGRVTRTHPVPAIVI